MSDSITFTISGDTPSKKNSRVLKIIKGRPISFPGKKYQTWHKEAVLEVPKLDEFRTCKEVRVVVFPSTLRKYDLSNKVESIMDTMVDAGLLEDDNINVVPRLVVEHGGKDKDNPRAEVTVVWA